jgi:opacity protein-like surface antigen
MGKGCTVLFLVLAMCGGNVLAVGFLGAPTAELNKGQWSVGFDYSHSEQDLDNSKVKWSWYADGVLDESGSTDIEVKDVTRDLYYATLGYGVCDRCQVYVKLGVASVEEEIDPGEDVRYFEDGRVSVDFDDDFAWGWGTKITVAEGERVAWGVAIQMNWLDTSWSEKDSDETETWKETVDIDAYDLLVAVGPTVDMDGWKIYGGPFFYYLSGDADATHRTLATADVSWSGKASGDLENDSSFGGYVGAQLDVADVWSMAVEFSFIDGWGLGAGIVRRF